MQLGAFSVSLTVKDIALSRAFYEKLGFSVTGGEQSQGWLIMKNGTTIIGLFQGMFDKNILTFNPGWDSEAKDLLSFTDVREIQQQLLAPYPGGQTGGDTLVEEGPHLPQQVVIVGLGLHGSRLALHVHQTDAAMRVGRHG